MSGCDSVPRLGIIERPALAVPATPVVATALLPQRAAECEVQREGSPAGMSDRHSDSPFVEFAAGATILDGGRVDGALYLVESGIVLVQLHGGATYAVGPGEVFGESALLESPPAVHASARSIVRALRIPAGDVGGVLQARPDIALALLRQLARRLHGVALAADTTIATADDTPPPVASEAKFEPPAHAPEASPGTTFVLRHAEGRLLLPTQGDWLVGRPDPATGAVPEVNLGPMDLARSLSRRHARIVLDGAGGIVVREEPGVSNGTWVNGARLAVGQSAALKSGDKLRFGAVEVELDVE